MDLYVINSGKNFLYRNDIAQGGGFVETGEMAGITRAGYSGGSWGDFDHDGDLDFYLASYEINRLYRNNGNNNNWLSIKAIGTVSNRSAIGTTIRLVADGRQRLRYVETTSGLGSQNSFAVEFGLGKATTIESVTINWLSGIEQVLENDTVNRFLTVTELAQDFVPDQLLIAEKTIELNGHNFMEGDIHSNRDIIFSDGKPGTLVGDVSAGRDVNIQKDNTIKGDILFHGAVTIAPNSTVTGTIIKSLDAIHMTLPNLTFDPTYGYDIIVAEDDEHTLAPGHYDRLRCMADAVLHLSSGTYHAGRLVMDNGARIMLDLSSRPVVINVAQRFIFREKSQIIIESLTGTAAEIHLNYNGTDKMVFGRNGSFQGNVVAPNARVKIAPGAGFLGSIQARYISVMADTRLRHHRISNGVPKPGDSLKNNDNNVVITNYRLEQNYPNPFNPITTIQFDLPEPGKVKLSVYNLRGELVQTVLHQEMPADHHTVGFYASGLTSGIYFYRLQTENFVAMRKMTLMK